MSFIKVIVISDNCDFCDPVLPGELFRKHRLQAVLPPFFSNPMDTVIFFALWNNFDDQFC